MKLTTARVEFDRGSATAATIRIVRVGKAVHVSLTDADGTSELPKDERDIVIAQYLALVTTCEVFHRAGLRRNRGDKR